MVRLYVDFREGERRERSYTLLEASISVHSKAVIMILMLSFSLLRRSRGQKTSKELG
jgi:hypothetical protein